MPAETQFPQVHEPALPSLPVSPAADDSVSLFDLIIVLAERRALILKVTAICAILAVIVVLLLPPQYTATTVLLPPQQQNSSISALLSSQLGGLGSMAMLAGGGLGLKNPNDMYVGMLKSDTVEDALIDDYGLRAEYHKRRLSDTRKKLEKYVTIDGDGKDQLIRISVEDHDPKRAAELANAYVNEFRKLSAVLAITEAAQRRKFFGDQLEQAKDNLADAEEALKQTEESTGLIELDSQARALIESAAVLRAQITAKEVEIQALGTFATGDNAQMMEAQQELASLRAQLAKLGGSEENPDSLIVPKGRVPEAGLEYVRKMRDVKYYETIFDILARQFELAKLDEAKEGALIQVVDPAIVPDRKSFPQRTLTVLAATLAGLFLGVVIALAQAGITQLRSNPESAAKFALLQDILRRKRRSAP
jgi:tyrosine-protein kinase Etk/Wzc